MTHESKVHLPPVLCHAGDGNCYTAEQMISHWQASRRIALEDAAKVCDFERIVIAGNRSIENIDTHNRACDDCMKIIRSLK